MVIHHPSRDYKEDHIVSPFSDREKRREEKRQFSADRNLDRAPPKIINDGMIQSVVPSSLYCTLNVDDDCIRFPSLKFTCAIRATDQRVETGEMRPFRPDRYYVQQLISLR